MTEGDAGEAVPEAAKAKSEAPEQDANQPVSTASDEVIPTAPAPEATTEETAVETMPEPAPPAASAASEPIEVQSEPVDDPNKPKKRGWWSRALS